MNVSKQQQQTDRVKICLSCGEQYIVFNLDESLIRSSVSVRKGRLQLLKPSYDAFFIMSY